MKYYRKIVGEKVYLSPLCVEDAETYTKWLNNFEVTDGLNSSYRMFNLEAEKEWINNMLTKNEYCFAIVDKNTDELLGNCGLHNLNFIQRTAEVGIFIGEVDNHSKGYGTDALKTLVDYCFGYLNLHTVYLRVFSFNKKAIRCYEKVGFAKCGELHEMYTINGTKYDEYIMEIVSKYDNK